MKLVEGKDSNLSHNDAAYLQPNDTGRNGKLALKSGRRPAQLRWNACFLERCKPALVELRC